MQTNISGPSRRNSSQSRSTARQGAQIITGNDVCQLGRDLFYKAAEYAPEGSCSSKKLEKIGNAIERKRAQFYEGLEKVLPRGTSNAQLGTKRVRDQEYIWISDWCNINGFQDWGQRPRTFTILHMMGMPDALDVFVQEGLYDIAIPYTEENLPRVITGSKRKDFLDLQQYVLTAHAKALEKSGVHQHVHGSADEFFLQGGELGRGGFGTVDQVFSRQSMRPYARKRLARGKTFKRDREQLRTFENELRHLKTLSHRHLVKLIGSYTDRTYVGLIMTPVADMNLDEFLNDTSIKPADRQHCLRRFFGCLATAVEYLHQNRIRHKDIKPKNVLVKNRQVLLTDFGTSYSWADDARATTSGTNKQAITKAYCAPEVFINGVSGLNRIRFLSATNDLQPRDTSSDIWSLGCVFYDMSTVLAGFMLEDRKAFFRDNGSHEPFIRINEKATKMWTDQHLRQQASEPEDNQLLDLFQLMCQKNAGDRPSATEIVSTILDFEGPPFYYGDCCDKNDTHKPADADPDNTTAYQTETIEVEVVANSIEASTTPISSAGDVATGVTLAVGPSPLSSNLSPVSSVSGEHLLGQDQEQTVSVAKTSPEDTTPERLHQRLADHRHPTESNDELRAKSAVSKPSEAGKQSSDSSSDSMLTSEGTINYTPAANTVPARPLAPSLYNPPTVEEVEDGMTIRILIPTEDELNNDALPQLDQEVIVHPATVVAHQNDECQPKLNLAQEAGQDNSCDQPRAWWDKTTDGICPYPHCDFSSGVASGVSLNCHIRAHHGVHDLYWTALLREPALEDPRSATIDHFTTNLHAAVRARRRAIQDRRAALSASDDHEEGINTSRRRNPSRSKNVRFSENLSHVPPREQQQQQQQQEQPSSTASPEQYTTCSELEHLGPQHWQMLWNLASEEAGAADVEQWQMPRSSLTPSLVQASMNLFSSSQVRSFGRTSSSKPLFVYGSLMFPSILNARAEAYMSSEGVYSPQLQRRLRTTPWDWAKLHISLQHCAEAMTPAVLSHHFTVRERGLGPAWLKRSTDSIDTVSGFLIFGLSEDAVTCLEHMFTTDSDRDLCLESAGAAWPSDLTIKRLAIRPMITTMEGTKMAVEAQTLIGNSMLNHNASYHSQIHQLGGFRPLPWNINRFVRGRCYRKLSTKHIGSAPWVDEEERLAEELNIKFVLHGDALCDAILNEDTTLAFELLDRGGDVNAPCHVYQNALQAAAFKGAEAIAARLIECGAAVNDKGGQFQTALIAATVKGHEKIAKLLLYSGAHVLADGGHYISAMYQAVDFDDTRLAHLLLEKGAWLSHNYQELLDLARERNNKKMSRLLEDYDVKMLHRRKGQRRESSSDTASSDADSCTGSDADSDAPTIGSPSAHDIRRDEVRRRRRSDDSDEQISVVNKSALIRTVGMKIMLLKGQRGKWTGIKGVQIFKTAIRAGMSDDIVDRARPHLYAAQNVLDWLVKAVTEMDEQDGGPERRERGAIRDARTPDNDQRRPHRPDKQQRRRTRTNSTNTASLPNYSSTRLPTYSSLSLVEQLGLQAIGNVGGDRSGSNGSNDTVCLTCEGRGGRAGTGNRCSLCDGTGRTRRRDDSGRRSSNGRRGEGSTCGVCSGRGRVYAQRDVCRDCSGSGGFGDASGRRGVDGVRKGGDEAEPPPPYSV